MPLPFCPVTGHAACKCVPAAYQQDSPMQRLMTMDTKGALRNLWREHGQLTAAVIEQAFGSPVRNLLYNPHPSLKAYLNRLMRNQSDLANFLKPFIGLTKSQEIERLLKEHIQLAVGAVNALIANQNIQEAVQAFQSNGDQVAQTMASWRASSIPLKQISQMFRTHVDQVVQLASMRSKPLETDWTVYVNLVDTYMRHLSALADFLYQALTSPPLARRTVSYSTQHSDAFYNAFADQPRPSATYRFGRRFS